MANPSTNSLVLYKSQPARVVSASSKLEIELEDGKTLKVRPKDVQVLHEGPLARMADLKAMSGEVEIAWEILAGEHTTVAELAELIFDQVTPSSVWAAWEFVVEGLYFQGTPDDIYVRTQEEMDSERAAREAKDADEQAWTDFLDRVRDGQILPAERENLTGVEALAYGRTSQSRVLRELGSGMTPENAHALLLRLGHWDETANPYPQRFELPTDPPAQELGDLPEEERLDLTHLEAFAIDDAGNKDPDDAISLEGNRLWVHVADVAALVKPRSNVDLEARGRAGNLYLPDQVVPMLPEKATELLGLGLKELSPALSFAMEIDDAGCIANIDIKRTTVRVTRLTYEEADELLDREPFAGLAAMAQRFKQFRKEHGSAVIDLPEVKLKVEDGQVIITPLRRLESREMVTNAMLMAGHAAAKFALDHHIPFPFTTQAPPDTHAYPDKLSDMFAYRKQFKRSQVKTIPEPHSGLGLEVYTRATSPLRRYLDLVAHPQLRAFLLDEELLSPQEITERVGATEAVGDSLRRAEQYSNKHWTLVYLQQNPDWQGTGVLVEVRGKRGTVIIPELGFEAQLQMEDPPPLETELLLLIKKVDLATQHVRFGIVKD